MKNETLQIKVMERLNKLASFDYDNIECWKIAEAFNKGMVQWCRRNLHGTNILKEGDEETKNKIDDLEILLKSKRLGGLTRRNRYYSTSAKPDDYFGYKRMDVRAKKDCCEGERQFAVYLGEEANTEILLRDKNRKPNFEWAETFITMKGNRFKIFTNNEFEITRAELTYYRQPIRVEFAGCFDPYKGVQTTTNVECEFKDDITELMIDECVKIISGDLENTTQVQISSGNVENNN